MLVDVRTAKQAWGLWTTAPHTALHLYEMHDTQRSAITSAGELLRKGWCDYAVVRRVQLGAPVVVDHPKPLRPSK